MRTLLPLIYYVYRAAPLGRCRLFKIRKSADELSQPNWSPVVASVDGKLADPSDRLDGGVVDTMTDQPDPIGPFVPLDPAEQLTRRRSLPAPVVIFGGPIIGLCSHWRG